MRKVFHQLSHAFLDLLYPPICLHCSDSLEAGFKIFCPACQSQLSLIDPAGRCPYCFTDDYNMDKKLCPSCFRCKPVLHRTAAAFDYAGPASTLVKRLKYAGQPYLAKGAGAFLAGQFLQLDWTMPDLLVPVPMAFTHWIERGYNQSMLLAESLGNILNVPVKNVLKRRSGDYSQAGLTFKQRMELSGNSFSLFEGEDLADKTIVLIDDVMTTGSTLRLCAEALIPGCPRNIYGLTLCRAIK